MQLTHNSQHVAQMALHTGSNPMGFCELNSEAKKKSKESVLFFPMQRLSIVLTFQKTRLSLYLKKE
jgi:hypothetical protein